MKHNAANERIKRDYFRYLAEAKGRDEATIDDVAKALARFEESTKNKDFKRFHREQAMAFKARMAVATNARTGERLSKATVLSTMRELRAFFFWLAHLPGFKSHIAYDDAQYFNLSDKDVAIARARRVKRVPTPEQVRHVLSVMPTKTPLERRDRALVAFAAVTAARVGALVSFRLGHVDLAGGFVEQDARTVETKFAKTFRTYFMDIGGDAEAIVREWIEELTHAHLRGPSDPLFPSTEMGLDEAGGFVAKGLSHNGWVTTEPVRGLFRKAFAAAGLPYFNPHSFRDMLVGHALARNLSLESMKAWSQNLGHSDVLTTLTSYGSIPAHRQGELIRGAAAGMCPARASREEIASVESLLARLKAPGSE